MIDSNRRKNLEADLEKAIRLAEKETFTNPQLQAMVRRLRDLYLTDKDEFLFMMQASPPPQVHAQKRRQPKLPPSKIPQLLAMLDALVTNKPLPVLPSIKNLGEGMPSPLILSLPRADELKPVSKPVISVYSPAPPISEANRKEIESLEVEIRKVKAVYELVKKDEENIRNKKGKYGIAFERLKAERLLRELPEQIRHMIHKKRMLEEGLLGS
ncbi:MAG: hypothetical protein C4527_15525 [Candidatus Omnitrophota bacterium]|jgi:hypothetical protein|nr:MAG: hypothetical protein C4527_15525 [Candidatus Omnitrophota bacterium]